MKKFSDMGVETKETPLEVAEASDVVITMLPSSSHVSFLVYVILFIGIDSIFWKKLSFNGLPLFTKPIVRANLNLVPRRNHLLMFSSVFYSFTY